MFDFDAVMVCILKYYISVIIDVRGGDGGVPIKVVDVVNPYRKNSCQRMDSYWPCLEL